MVDVVLHLRENALLLVGELCKLLVHEVCEILALAVPYYVVKHWEEQVIHLYQLQQVLYYRGKGLRVVLWECLQKVPHNEVRYTSWILVLEPLVLPTHCLD